MAASTWDGLEGLTVDPSNRDTIDLAGLHVAIAGSWDRRSVAVVGAFADDDVTNVVTLGAWEHQPHAVPVDEIVAAIHSLDIVPATISVGRATQSTEVSERLEADGLFVVEVETTSAKPMQTRTDLLLSRLTAGQLRHDNAEPLRRQMLGARTQVRREGMVLARDDRTDQRIDAVVAAAVAIEAVSLSPVIGVY